jgi:ABC-type transport system substrate-binding protein
MWRDGLGIKVDVDTSGGDPTNLHAALTGWFPDYPDTASYLAAATSRFYPPPTERTVGLIEASVTTADPAGRQQALDAAQQALADEFISAPLSFASFPWYVSTPIANLPFDANSVPLLHRATVVG